MSMNISAIGSGVLNSYSSSLNSIASSYEKLATGNRINNSGDDASGLAILQKMYSMTTEMDATSSNLQDAMSYLQVADGVAGSVSEMYLRLDELTLRASSSIMGDTERSILQTEADQITAEIARLTENTNFNGTQIFSGKDFAISGEDGMSINLSEFIVPEIDLSSVGSATQSLDNIKSARDALAQTRGTIGAMDNRIEHNVANLAVTSENLVAAGSRIGDTNYAMEILSMARDNLLQNSSIAVMSQQNYNAGLILQLFR